MTYTTTPILLFTTTHPPPFPLHNNPSSAHEVDPFVLENADKTISKQRGKSGDFLSWGYLLYHCTGRNFIVRLTGIPAHHGDAPAVL